MKDLSVGGRGFVFTIILLFSACSHRSDELSMQPFEGYPLIQNRGEIKQVLRDKCLDTIAFKKGQIVADIGAGNGYLEAMLSLFHDSLTFYIQDIDSSVCNQLNLEKVVQFYEEVNGHPFSNQFMIVNGTDDRSNLPEVGFDKILMLWTYQYIKQPVPFIMDLRSKMKDEGLLYVINPEQDREYGLELKMKYGWNGSTVEEQISDIIHCGFELLHFTRNYESGEHPFMMVFRKK